MSEVVLHEDDPERDGNLSAAEYEATYSDEGLEACGVPEEAVTAAEAALNVPLVPNAGDAGDPDLTEEDDDWSGDAAVSPFADPGDVPAEEGDQ